jgi:hypothetical protein
MILPGARAVGENDRAASQLHEGIVAHKRQNLSHEGVKDMRRAKEERSSLYSTVEEN